MMSNTNNPIECHIDATYTYITCKKCQLQTELRKNGLPKAAFINHFEWCPRLRRQLTAQELEQLLGYARQKKTEKEAFAVRCAEEREERKRRIGRIQMEIDEKQDQLAEKNRILAEKIAILREEMGINDLSSSLSQLLDSKYELLNIYNGLCKHLRTSRISNRCCCEICGYSWFEEYESGGN
jgi:hypothetical protein